MGQQIETSPAGYFVDRARVVLARASASPDADPAELARWAEDAKGRNQRTGGVLVTQDGRIVAEWHQRRATATDPGGAWVAPEDMRRIVGGASWVTALDFAQVQIGRGLGEPVAALRASELTSGRGRQAGA